MINRKVLCCTVQGTIFNILDESWWKRNFKRIYTYMCVCACVYSWITLLIQQKLMQHCKSIILQLKTIIRNLNHCPWEIKDMGSSLKKYRNVSRARSLSVACGRNQGETKKDLSWALMSGESRRGVQALGDLSWALVSSYSGSACLCCPLYVSFTPSCFRHALYLERKMAAPSPKPNKIPKEKESPLSAGLYGISEEKCCTI